MVRVYMYVPIMYIEIQFIAKNLPVWCLTAWKSMWPYPTNCGKTATLFPTNCGLSWWDCFYSVILYSLFRERNSDWDQKHSINRTEESQGFWKIIAVSHNLSTTTLILQVLSTAHCICMHAVGVGCSLHLYRPTISLQVYTVCINSA